MSSRNRLLYVVALVLACACVARRRARVPASATTARTPGPSRSGTATCSRRPRKEIEAFINIDYREAQASIDAVAAGATGEFAKQYTQSADSVIEVLEQNQSVMDGEVVWAGVVGLDADSAPVIAATTGTVANTSTDNKPVRATSGSSST